MALSKRLWFGAAVATVAVGTATGVRRCDPIPIEPPTDFSYAVHLKPRVFVMHRRERSRDQPRFIGTKIRWSLRWTSNAR